MKHRFAFAGFRHGHIYGLYDRVKNAAGCEIVGACEEDVAGRTTVRNDIKLNSASIAEMLGMTGRPVISTLSPITSRILPVELVPS